MTLRDLKVGASATILTVGGEGALRQHFLDMGLIPGTEVTVVKYAPMGDPVELRLHGYELTLRVADAEKIQVAEGKPNPTRTHTSARRKDIPPPGLGAGGKYHVKA
ncbi:MAG: ferrous iron transport protein A, partial [Clostridiales bacterium]|nr:ferrous iron transport protein A [Clostridiales bacterium]